MNLKFLSKIIIATFFCVTIANADDATINITAPTEGAHLKLADKNLISYEVTVPKGSKGNHVHIYIDGKEMASLHDLKGSRPLKNLTVGERQICVKVANKAHVALGEGSCVKVTVE